MTARPFTTAASIDGDWLVIDDRGRTITFRATRRSANAVAQRLNASDSAEQARAMARMRVRPRPLEEQ